jgi:hypothetical protein
MKKGYYTALTINALGIGIHPSGKPQHQKAERYTITSDIEVERHHAQPQWCKQPLRRILQLWLHLIIQDDIMCRW